MAQIIRKFSGGGSTSNKENAQTPTSETKKKYGKFTHDGQEYEVDDNLLGQIGAYSQIVADSLRKGNDVYSYKDDNGVRVVSGIDSSNSDLNERQQQRLGRKQRILEGRRVRDARNEIDRLNSLVLNPTRPKEDTTPKLKYFDLNDDIYLNYVPDEKGNKHLSVTESNRLAEERLNLYLHPESLDKTKYNELRYGTYFRDADAANAFINKARPILESDEFKQRYNSGTLTESDKAMLKSMGILTERPSGSPDDNSGTGSGGWKSKEDEQKYGNFFVLNSDGTFGISDNSPLKDFLTSGNVWLNDQFNTYTNGAYSSILGDDGIFFINGKGYRGNDSRLDALKPFLDFTSLNRNNRYEDANKIIKQYWGEGVNPYSQLAYDANNNPVYYDAFDDSYLKGAYGYDASGEYQELRNENGIPYVVYNTYGSDAKRDRYGHVLDESKLITVVDPITGRKVEVPYGEKLTIPRSDVKESTLARIYATPFEDQNIRARMQGFGSPDVDGLYSQAIYTTPDNRYYYYSRNPGDNDWRAKQYSGLGKARDYAYELTPEVYQFIQQHPEFITDASKRRQLEALIYGRIGSENNSRIIPQFNSNNYTLTNEEGFNGYNTIIDQSNPLWSLINRIYNNPSSYYQRGVDENNYKTNNFIRRMATYQIGGTIHTKKHENKTSEAPIKSLDNKFRLVGEDKIIGDKTNLTDSDWAELAALGADTLALGATFVPGIGNIGAAAIGGAGSLAGFTADITRDGLDWGDVGNLALNLGLDAATLLPGVGTGAKAAKIVKALKKSKAVEKGIKYASYALSGTGAINGLTTAWDNIKTGDWTIKDVRIVLNGLRGISNIARTKGSAKTKPSDSDTITLTSNSHLPDIKLTRAEINAIETAPKKEQLDKLEELLIGKLGKDVKTDNVKNILAEYGINRSNSFSWNVKKPFKISKNQSLNTDQFKYDQVPGAYRNPNEMSWWNWNRRAAIRDAKQNRNNPYFKDFAKNKISEIEYAPLEIVRSIEPDGNVAKSITTWPNRLISSYRRAPITKPIYSNLALDLGVFGKVPEEHLYYEGNNPIFYKKGGVIKAQNGEKFGPIASYDDLHKQMFTAPPKLEPREIDNQNSEKQTWLGKLKSNLDWLSISKHATDLTRGILPQIASNKINRTRKKGIWDKAQGMQKSFAPEYYERFSDYGLNRATDARINSMRGYQYNTSDPMLQTADRLAREQQVSQIEADRDLKYSQMQSEFNQRTLDAKRQYARDRRQVADYNKEVLGNAKYLMAESDASNVSRKNDVITGMLGQLSSQLITDLKEKNIADAAKENVDIMNTYSQNAQKGYDILKGIYDKERAKYKGADLEAWDKANPWNDVVTKYFNPKLAEGQHWVNQATATSIYNVGHNQNPFIKRGPLVTGTWTPNWNFDIKFNSIPANFGDQQQPHGTLSNKKGGKMYLDANERALLDAASDARKAVRQMDNNLVKLIISLMK